MGGSLEAAAAAVRSGLLVVFPTETVYGLGADAMDPDAIRRVFAAKGRAPDRPISMAYPSVEAALETVVASERERAFMREFLPGPATVLLAHEGRVPSVLTGDRDRVGIRIPDHEVADRFLTAVAPVTATSANRSGRPAATRLADVDGSILSGAAVHLDGGRTGGGASTVVDVSTDEIVRAGRDHAAIERWLREN